MALPSQTFGNSRFTAARPRRGGAGRGKGKRFVGIGALAALAAIAWLFWPEPDGAGPVAPPTVDPAERAAQTADAPIRRATGPSAGADAGTPSRPGPRSASLVDRPSRTPTTTDPAPTPADDTDEPAEAAQPLAGTRNRPADARPQADNAPPETTPAAQSVTPVGELARLVDRGAAAWAANRPLEARDLLNRALHHPQADPGTRGQIRASMREINELLVFSPRVLEGDPVAEVYEIQPGDLLARVTRDLGLAVDWRLLLRVNNIADARRIRAGQRMKVLRGPFHAVVHKGAYRLDLFADAADSQGNPIYVTSMPCGLGEYDSTPVGRFVVREDSKLINPHWVNPRTGERFDANDPENPIGERWIGLDGADDATRTLMGYGIHGTIEPDSIGRQQSMGCIRLLPDDVELVYEMLVPGRSVVEIRP